MSQSQLHRPYIYVIKDRFGKLLWHLSKPFQSIPQLKELFLRENVRSPAPVAHFEKEGFSVVKITYQGTVEKPQVPDYKAYYESEGFVRAASEDVEDITSSSVPTNLDAEALLPDPIKDFYIRKYQESHRANS